MHFSLFKRHELSLALTRVAIEIGEIIEEVEALETEHPILVGLRRAQANADYADACYRQYHSRVPKGLWAKRDESLDDDVRYIVGATYDSVQLIAALGKRELENLRERHA